ncbi:MAG: hypothetical protein WC315_00745 [Candidatus Omnitrophota bacterium]|jgi:hypothetical protein
MLRFYPYHPRDTDALAAVCQVVDICRIVEGRYEVVADNLTYMDAITMAENLNLQSAVES